MSVGELGLQPRLQQRVPRFMRPPGALNPQQWKLLFAMMVIGANTGYQGTVTTQAITFVADEFGSNKEAQGRALAVIRADIVLTLIIMRIADHIGRRRTLLVCAVVGPLLNVVCALMPSLPTFTAAQVLARSFVTAAAILLSVILVEELPAETRAWGASIAVAAAALGSSFTLMLLPIAGSQENAWRVMYLVPLIGIIPTLLVRSSVPESHRYERLQVQRAAGHQDSRWRHHLRRLSVIAFWVLLMGMMTNPSRQFLNDYLRDDRGFTATRLSIFGLVTNIPGTVGVLLGGAISDRKGRRLTAGVGLIGYAVATTALYLANGPTLWVAAMFGSLAGAFALPALSIMVTELFPTELRSRASGFSTGMNRIGSAAGLIIIGTFADRFTMGRLIGALACCLVIGTIAMLVFLPETSHRELEDISPVAFT
jgi:MFS family permease